MEGFSMTKDTNVSEVLDLQNEDLAQERGAQWEDEFFQQIIQYLDNPDQLFFCRLDLPPLTGSTCLVRETGHLAPRKKGISRWPRGVFQSSR